MFRKDIAIEDLIKMVAKIAFCLEAIILLIIGVVLIFDEAELITLAGIAIGAVSAYVVNLALFGLGELIELMRDIKSNTKHIKDNKTNTIYSNVKSDDADTLEIKESMVNEVKKQSHIWRCSNCGQMISGDSCPFCDK